MSLGYVGRNENLKDRKESTQANRFISQLLDYCPGNTPKVSNWSRNNPLSGLLTNIFGVFVSIIQ